ncbi:hypothetical protein [Rathayibacter festucae]|uniref:hypothetical protein n=1 Tax=Rathayibacter festucae TaxID=110937 RepID=UPI000FDAFF0B|nr:hypothetical protein [Rathayibacter festucae]
MANREPDPARDVRPALGRVGLDTPLRGYSTSMGVPLRGYSTSMGVPLRGYSTSMCFLLIE